MAYNDKTAQMLRDYYSDTELLDQSAAGNISSDDLAQLMQLPSSDDFLTATELTSLIGTVGDNTGTIIIDSIGQTETVTTDFATLLYNQQLEDLFNAEHDISDLLDSISATLNQNILDTQFVLDDLLSGYQTAIQSEIQADNDRIASVLDAISTNLFTQIGEVVGGVIDVVVDETSDILGLLAPSLDLLQETTDLVVDKTTNVAAALAEAIPEIGTVVASAVEGVGSAVTTGFGVALDGVMTGLGLDKLFDMFAMVQSAIGEISKELGGLEDLEVRPGSWDAPLSYVDGQNTVLGGLPWLGTVIHTKHPAEFERIGLDSKAWVRPTPLDSASTLEHMRRFPDSANQLRVNLERAGLSDERIEQLLSITYKPLGLAENLVALRREFISPEVFNDKLRALGLAQDDIELAEKLSMQLPPIGDLIRMVVRDTFEPDVVEEGKLSEGFDTFPVEFAEQQGINPYWSEKYWQAHWELPSLNQGFEMLHRGKIDEAQLIALFKAADLAPGYWEPMQQIAFRPYSRVDVRRMHLFGVLDESQVLTSYLDLGYDQEKAQALTDFTIAYNESSKKVEKVKERDLTKSDIIGMYNDGLLETAPALAYLIDLGFSNGEATVLIEREDLQAEVKERKADIQNVIEQAKIKAITYEEAQDRLAGLDLTRTETNKALSALARASQTRTKTPSKSDLDSWLGLNLITSGDYAEELRTLGYADRYVSLYVEETTAETETDLLSAEGKAAVKREPRSVSKGNLDSLYQAEIITSDEYISGLTILGYRDSDISNLLQQQTIKIEERRLDEAERLARGDEAAVKERLPSRALLGKLFLKGLIDIDAYAEGLTLLGFSGPNIELLSKLITAKGEEIASKQAGNTDEAE